MKLYQLNCSLPLGVRDPERGEAAKWEIEELCKRKVGVRDDSDGGRKGRVGKWKIEVWACDLGDSDSLLDFVKKANGLERVDGVVLNAGAFG